MKFQHGKQTITKSLVAKQKSSHQLTMWYSMVAPIFRRWTRAAPGALDVFAFSTDDVTALTFYQLAAVNQLLDIVTDPAPGAGVRYEIALFKNGLDTGRHWFTNSLDAASAGRVAIGPVDLLPGQMQMSVAQRAGALAAVNFVTKLLTA